VWYSSGRWRSELRPFPGAIAVRTALVALLAASAAVCSSTTTASGPPFTTTLNGSSVPNLGLTSQQFTSDRLGIATVTLTYGTTASELDFLAAPAVCSGGPFTNSTPPCAADLAFLQSPATPKVLTFGVAKGQVVTLWIQQVSGAAPQAFSIAVSIQ
jgi:hypothetical protein